MVTPYVGEGGSKEFAVILKCNKVTKHIYGFNSLGLVDGGYTLGDVVDNEDEKYQDCLSVHLHHDGVLHQVYGAGQ